MSLQVKIVLSAREGLKALLACLAKADLANPLGLEDLSSCQSSRWMRVQDRVNDITAASLIGVLVHIFR